MALSDDQRALLRLLAKREDGYEDIAALKGLSVEQVRAEVNDALAELQAAGEAPQPLPSPPAVEEPSAPAPAPAEKRDPTPPPPSSTVKREPRARAPRAVRPALPAERRRLLLLTGGALAIVALVLIAFAVFGSDGSDSSSDASSGSGIEAATAENSKVTQAVLEPADGSDAAGNAVFGKLGKEEIVLQVTAEGLEPSEKGESYTVWLYRSPKLALRVGSVPVGESGRLGARFTIPAELLAYVASGAFDRIYVSRTSDAAYRQEVAQARRNKSLPQYTGETVLAGEITGPVAKAGEGG